MDEESLENSISLETSEIVNENTLQDDLFLLKNAILTKNKLSKGYSAYLNQIFNLLSDRGDFSHLLFNWSFLTRELIYCLRSNSFNLAIQTATIIIKNVKKIPTQFLTKKFLFFITEKLYNSNDFNNSNFNTNTKHILEFIKEMIEVAPTILLTLHETGFFILTNGLLKQETCVLYDTIFKDVFYFKQTLFNKPKDYEKDAVYEILRKNFDSEIIFKEKDIITLKSLNYVYKSGIYEQIYNGCTNIKHLIDISAKNTLHLVLYKPISYINNEIDIMISESNELAIKVYRRALECGYPPDSSYFPSLLRALDNKSSQLDSIICLYYIIDYLKDFSKFSSDKIKLVFECLEFECESNCIRDCENDKSFRLCFKRQQEKENKNQCAFDYCSFGDASIGPINFTPRGGLQNFDFSFDIPEDNIEKNIQEKNNEEEFPKEMIDVNKCNRIRILKLIKSLYSTLEHKLFFKPTYLILIRINCNHCKEEIEFIREYMRDFILFIKNKNNLARTLLPAVVEKKKRKEKLRTIEIDSIDSLEEEDKENSMQNNNSQCQIEGIKIKGNMIESEEEQEKENENPQDQIKGIKIKGNFIESEEENFFPTSLLPESEL